MKKIISFIAVIFVTSAALAQVNLGITAGANFAKLNISASGFTVKTSTLTSFHAGLIADASLASNIHFQPQLLLSGKGGKVTSDGQSATINPFYLELPLNFIYKAEAGSGQIFGGVGPYAAFGLFGKAKGGGESHDIKFGSGDNDDLKSTDFGGNVIAGYQLNSGLMIMANYSFGLADCAPKSSDGKIKNSYFGISLAYMFSSNKSGNE